MFSIIYLEKESDDLFVIQVLKSYQLDFIRYVENEEGDESLGEIVQSENEMEKIDYVIEVDNKSVKFSKSVKFFKFVYSVYVVDDRLVKSGKLSGYRSVILFIYYQDLFSVKFGKF